MRAVHHEDPGIREVCLALFHLRQDQIIADTRVRRGQIAMIGERDAFLLRRPRVSFAGKMVVGQKVFREGLRPSETEGRNPLSCRERSRNAPPGSPAG